MSWKIEYGNDVDANDENFTEWWAVTDGKRSFKCSTEEDAEWLAKTLNQSEARRGD